LAIQLVLEYSKNKKNETLCLQEKQKENLQTKYRLEKPKLVGKETESHEKYFSHFWLNFHSSLSLDQVD